jgi:hypothetical protein
VITTVVKTHGRYWVSNPKQLADSILHWEESQLADIYHSSTPAPSVQLSIGDKVQTGKVTGRKRGLYGVARGKASANPILDTRTYNVEFPDVHSEEYTANVIAENMYEQCDEEENQFLVLQDIVGHKIDGNAVERADMYIKVGSNRKIRKTTKGWHLCVEWKDGTTRARFCLVGTSHPEEAKQNHCRRDQEVPQTHS